MFNDTNQDTSELTMETFQLVLLLFHRTDPGPDVGTVRTGRYQVG